MKFKNFWSKEPVKTESVSMWQPDSLSKQYENLETPSENIILTKTNSFSRNRSFVNSTVLLVSESGNEKVIQANILQKDENTNECLFILDPNGDILSETKPALEEAGYETKVVDMLHKENCEKFNPLAYIPYKNACGEVTAYNLPLEKIQAQGWVVSANEMNELVFCIIQNTKNGYVQRYDNFWTNVNVMVLQSLVAYVMENKEPENRNLVTVLELTKERERLKDIFKEWELKNPNSYGVKVLNSAMCALSNNTEYHIALEMLEYRLSALNDPKYACLMEEDAMSLSVSVEKAYFVIPDPQHTVTASLFVGVALQLNEEEAKKCRIAGGEKVHTNFFLENCGTAGTIYNLYIHTMCARGTRTTFLTSFRSVTQIEDLYGCNSGLFEVSEYIMYFGSKSLHTKEYFEKNYAQGKSLTIPASKVLLIDKNDMSSVRVGYLSEEYKLSEHPRYNLVSKQVNPPFLH